MQTRQDHNTVPYTIANTDRQFAENLPNTETRKRGSRGAARRRADTGRIKTRITWVAQCTRQLQSQSLAAFSPKLSLPRTAVSLCTNFCFSKPRKTNFEKVPARNSYASEEGSQLFGDVSWHSWGLLVPSFVLESRFRCRLNGARCKWGWTEFHGFCPDLSLPGYGLHPPRTHDFKGFRPPAENCWINLVLQRCHPNKGFCE